MPLQLIGNNVMYETKPLLVISKYLTSFPFTIHFQVNMHTQKPCFGVYVIGNAQKIELTNILASTRSIINK
jgi:hypothetical protein